MKLYTFDPQTGKYLGSHDAQTDEWQTQIKGEICYTLEVNSTWDEPPHQEGYTAYYIGGEWVLKADPTLAELKAAKLEEIGKWTEAQITGGFKSSCTGAEVTYDSDKETQLTVSSDLNTIKSAPEAFADNYPTGYPMRGYPAGTDTTNSANKQIYYLSVEQLIQWNVDIGLHRGACKRAGWDKQAAVEAAQTAAELEAITL